MASEQDQSKRSKGEVIGEQFLRREPWTCDDCSAEFEIGAAWFDARSGIVCPKCKSFHIGPKNYQPKN